MWANAIGMPQDTALRTIRVEPINCGSCLRVKGTNRLKIGAVSQWGEAREPHFRATHVAIAGSVDLGREVVHVIPPRGEREKFRRNG